MKINRRPGCRFLTGFLAAVCLVSWASPSYALRTHQPGDAESGLEEIRGALAGLEEAPRIVVADKMDETQLGVPGVINVSALAKDQKREAVIAADPHILIVRSDFQLDAKLMGRLSHLKKVIRGGHGLDNIDLPYAASRDIEVRGTGGSEQSVTAWTVQAIGQAQAIRLNAAPAGPAQVSYPLGFDRSDWEAAQKEKAAKESPDSQPMLEQKFNALFQPVPGPAWDALRGKTVGIIGFGRIGKTIAFTARDLGMNVLAYAPSLEADPAPAQALGARFATKDEIYRSAHYIVLITGLYKEGPRRNVGMVDEAAVDLMLANENLIALIDPDRAGLVVEPEIVNLVVAGVQYFLDELPENPYLRENVQFTPHIGASTPQAKRQVIAETAAILREFVDELSAQAGLEESVEAKVRGVVFLVFDERLGWAITKQLDPVGAEVFIVAETPEIARRLISQKISPSRIIGVLRQEVDVEYYRKVSLEIRRFASGDSPEWGDEFAKRMQMGMGRRIIPIYNAEQMFTQLSALGVPGPMIQQILDQQAGMEEGLSIGT